MRIWKTTGGGEEETERNNLDEETKNNNIFPNLDSAAIEYQPGRTSLYQERKNIANDECLCDPCNPDNRVMLASDAAHNATQGHIDGSCEKGLCATPERPF
jgi:hypothetical protein